MLYDQVTTHSFAMIPKADIPRSVFKMKHSHKTTFDAGYLIPIYCEEVIPGDSFRGTMHALGRLATPIHPFMDDLTLESFFFFVPNRLVWSNFKKMMGERQNPDDSISYVVPQFESPVGGYEANSLFDYFGLPTVGQVDPTKSISHSSLPLRGYNLIYNEWFRDQNLINAASEAGGDGPHSNVSSYVLRRRGKRHDYFTSCLPWPQKGDPVQLSLGGSASLTGTASVSSSAVQVQSKDTVGANAGVWMNRTATYSNSSGDMMTSGVGNGGEYRFRLTDPTLDLSSVTADLSTATAATINAIRLAFQVQRLLERDARGGTRYTEVVLSHFGVRSPDMRLQRPEYIGGGSTPVVIQGVQQTSATDGTSPQGNLAATGTLMTQGGHSFNFSASEHGYIIGIVNIRGENTYQQGLRRHWSKQTRYDFYWPSFAHLGEQAVLQKEIYCTGDPDNDELVFGYQERYGEYRFSPSQITGLFRSTAAQSLDVWHLAQKFETSPTLNKTFIEETPPVDRVLAVPSQTGKQFYFDALFDVTVARPLPMYGVPGLVDHF